jgi:hypothetical protein
MPSDDRDQGQDPRSADRESEPEQGHPHGQERGRTLGHYVRDFFANWNESDAPLATKVRLTVRNRLKAYAPPFRGCCGRLGEPGC